MTRKLVCSIACAILIVASAGEAAACSSGGGGNLGAGLLVGSSALLAVPITGSNLGFTIGAARRGRRFSRNAAIAEVATMSVNLSGSAILMSPLGWITMGTLPAAVLGATNAGWSLGLLIHGIVALSNRDRASDDRDVHEREPSTWSKITIAPGAVSDGAQTGAGLIAVGRF